MVERRNAFEISFETREQISCKRSHAAFDAFTLQGKYASNTDDALATKTSTTMQTARTNTHLRPVRIASERVAQLIFHFSFYLQHTLTGIVHKNKMKAIWTIRRAMH